MIFDIHKDFLTQVKQKYHLEYKLMAMDLGDKKIGLATCHSTLKIAIPYRVLTRTNIKADMKDIISIIREQSIAGIIIGLPVDNFGNFNANTEKVMNFAHRMIKGVDIPITFYDERFTTRLANTMLLELNMKRKERNKIDDQISATILLTDFLKLNWNHL